MLRIDGPEGGVATITLARPERKNALSLALRDEISDALDALAEEDEVKVLIVAAEGDVFCAGFDLKEFDKAAADPAFSEALWASSDRYHRTVLEFALPTIACVNGPAIAGGFDLAVMCDLRVGNGRASFSHPEVTFGDVVYSPLHDLVGGAVARDLCFTGRAIDADEALRLGVLNRLVNADALQDAARETAHEIARAPRTLLLRTKAKASRRAGIVAGATLDL